ncbi:unnamed protein product [Musa acuminata subsp. burmannicoides]
MPLWMNMVTAAAATSVVAGRSKEMTRVTGPWRAEEDEALLRLVERHGPRNWSLISRSIPGGRASRAASGGATSCRPGGAPPLHCRGGRGHRPRPPPLGQQVGHHRPPPLRPHRQRHQEPLVLHPQAQVLAAAGRRRRGVCHGSGSQGRAGGKAVQEGELRRGGVHVCGLGDLPEIREPVHVGCERLQPSGCVSR